MKFTQNLSILLVAGWVICVGGIEWRRYEHRIDALIHEKTREGESAAHDLAQLLEKSLGFYHSLPQMLAQDPVVQAGLTSLACPEAATNNPGESALDNLNALLHRVQGTIGPDIIWVMDTNGTCVASSDSGQPSSGVGGNYEYREYFRQARQAGVGEQFAIGRKVRKPGLYFCARVTQNERFIGAVAIKLNLDRLSDCLDLPDSFLVDSYGVVILAKNPAFFLTALPSNQVEEMSPAMRQERYQQEHFALLSMVPWRVTNAAPLILFNQETPPQLLFSNALPLEELRVYVPKALPELLTLRRDYGQTFMLLATAGGSLILLLAASFNYSQQQHRANRELRKQSELLTEAERIARLGSWSCEWPNGQLQLSEQAGEILQVPPGEDPGTYAYFAELSLPNDQQRVRQVIHQAIDLGETFDLEYGLVRPDDGQTIIHLHGQMIRGSHGRAGRLAGTVQDVTFRRRVEQEAMQTVSLLKATLESITDGILVVDLAGKVTSYNERFLKMWQVPREVFDTRQSEVLLQFVAGQIRAPEEFLARVKALYQNPLLESFDLLEFQDGRIFERVSKPQLIAGQPVGRVWSFYDITDRQRAEASLLESERRLRMVIEATGDLIFLKDGAGRWELINQSARRWFGLMEIDYQGMADHELAAVLPHLKREFDVCAQTDQQAWENRKPTPAEEYVPGPNGRMHCFDVIKVPVFKDDGARQSLVVVGRDITERKRTEQDLFKSRETLRMVLNNIPQRVFWKNRELVYEGCNVAMVRHYGLADQAGLIGKMDYDLYDAETAESYAALDRTIMATDQPKLNFQVTERRPDGSLAHLLVSKLPLHDQNGQVSGILGTFDDITAYKLLEAQFRQSQKMEAIGRLAGGIAHDFNNLLTVICGYSEVLLHDLPPDDAARMAVTEIRKAGDRAAALTRKLLAYSRKQVLEAGVLDLNALVSDCENMFRRLLGEDIELTIKLAANLGRIKADANQIDQVMLNLVVNSRDAMPRGGKLLIETTNAVLTEADRQRSEEIIPGNYVCLIISDTGCGMDASTISHLFEPFFTTKDQGKGTGLGLAMVFGFIKQSGGHIAATSEVGSGSIFRIYLPEFVEPVN